MPAASSETTTAEGDCGAKKATPPLTGREVVVAAAPPLLFVAVVAVPASPASPPLPGTTMSRASKSKPVTAQWVSEVWGIDELRS